MPKSAPATKKPARKKPAPAPAKRAKKPAAPAPAAAKSKKPSPRAAAPGKPRKPPAPPPPPPPERTPAEYFAYYLPLARAHLKGADEPVFRAPVAIATANVRYATERHGLTAEWLTGKYRALTLDHLLEVRPIALALEHAQRRVPGFVASDKETQRRVALVAPLREDALAAARTFVRRGLLPAERVASIEPGSGPLDIGGDALALVELFAEFATAVQGQHALTAADFAAMREHGTWLLDNVIPGRTRRVTSARTPESRDRDALAAYLRHRYDELRAAAFTAHGESAFDQYVPPLLSARVESAEATDDGEEGGEGGEGGGPKKDPTPAEPEKQPDGRSKDEPAAKK